jgi:peptide/nickel transport system permease protein
LTARVGLVVPGLGHLLTGQWLSGATLLVVDLVWFLAGATGLPRVLDVLGSAHGVAALGAWFAVGAALWLAAWQLAFPRTLTDTQRHTTRRIAWRQFRVHRTGMLGLTGVLAVLLLTVFTPMLAPFDPDAIDVGAKNLPPSPEFWLGTDKFGRDTLSRLLFGGRVSLSIGFITVTIAATLGTLLGAVAGYAGGRVDRGLMWLTDLMLSMPRLVLLITVAGLFRVPGSAKLFMLVAILGLTGWMPVARIVRSEVLSLKEREYVLAARAIGLSHSRIVLRHLLPNAMAPVIVYCSLAIGSTILAEAALSFLGLGVPPPTATWGAMVNDARQFLRSAPWTALFPGLAIVFAVTSFNLLGDGLRDALDPKLRH